MSDIKPRSVTGDLSEYPLCGGPKCPSFSCQDGNEYIDARCGIIREPIPRWEYYPCAPAIRDKLEAAEAEAEADKLTELRSEMGELRDDLRRVREERDNLEDEVALLRVIFPQILSALGNGSACTVDAPVEFMYQIPDKVKADVARLRVVIERVLVCNDAITVGALREKLRAALAGEVEE